MPGHEEAPHAGPEPGQVLHLLSELEAALTHLVQELRAHVAGVSAPFVGPGTLETCRQNDPVELLRFFATKKKRI